MDRLDELKLVVHIAELGSLSRAADALGLSNATATRGLAALEKRLGVRLVERNTRRLHMTQAGESFVERCKAILMDIEDAQAVAQSTVVQPSGVLRISGSQSICMMHVAPLLPALYERYPFLRMEIVVANRYDDLLDSGVDVALRTRETEVDSLSLTVRRLAQTRRVLAASPRYLQTHGVPLSISALNEHRLLIYSYSNRSDELQFRRGEENSVLRVRGLLSANDGQVLRAAALAHHGILVQPMYVIHDDIVAGRLVPVLQEWELPGLTINIAYQSREYLPARVRCFVDFMIDHFQRMGLEHRWTSPS
jgi:DNA-binding transcriptional LysR family regulator